VKAEILQSVGAPPDSVEDCFRRALDIASRQGALSYALRAATDLARFLSEQDRFAEARGLLAPIVDSFTEGFGTTDMKAARQLLANLA
jgi:predicted ATPase